MLGALFVTSNTRFPRSTKGEILHQPLWTDERAPQLFNFSVQFEFDFRFRFRFRLAAHSGIIPDEEAGTQPRALRARSALVSRYYRLVRIFQLQLLIPATCVFSVLRFLEKGEN